MRYITLSLEENGHLVQIKIPIDSSKKDIVPLLATTYQKLCRDLEKSQWRHEISSPIKGRN